MKKPKPSPEEGRKFAGAFFMVLILVTLISSCVSGELFEENDYEPSSTYEDEGEENFRRSVEWLEEELEQERKYGDKWSDNN